LNPSKYEFTNNWFEHGAKIHFDLIFDKLAKPKTILEIGSFEGQSTCYFIEKISEFNQAPEIFCIDTWEGGQEHKQGKINYTEMNQAEYRFKKNIQHAIDRVKNKATVTAKKCESCAALSQLIVDKKSEYFDLVYIDASHDAADVLQDAILSFRLLKVGGIIVFDDYLWGTWGSRSNSQNNIMRCPKMGIDSFVNCFYEKIQVDPNFFAHQIVAKKITN